MNKKFYVTTSIPYANSVPHIGNVLDSVYADVLARFYRQQKYDVMYLTGVDEHGVKIVRAAEANGLTPQEFVDKNSSEFRALRGVLDLSWDDFIRTSDKARHYPGAKKMWLALAKSGDLYKKIYEGLYCVGHEAFVTEKDLVGGVCRDHQKKPETIKEENWFFKLSKYSEEIGSKIRSGELKIVPESRKNEILSLIESGLEDVSFSRPRKDLSWGVPVPDDETQTMYVWADALTNYISALGYGSGDESRFKKYWPADAQIIGKDNLRFHAGIWPGMLLSAGLPLPKTIFVHGFITVSGEKISKTVGNVIDPVSLVKKYGADPVRYYLLREVPPYDDGDFSYEKFEEKYNGDLANGLGNFSSRVLKLGSKTDFGGIDLGRDVEDAVGRKISETKKNVKEKLEEFKFHEALAAIWELISFGDAYVNDKKPWDTKNKRDILNLVVILDNVSAIVEPFLPASSEKIKSNIMWRDHVLTVSAASPLFPRL